MASSVKWILNVNLATLLTVYLAHAIECPLNWLQFSGSCYLFREWPLMKRDHARTFCSDNGGGLVTVTSQGEHSFISRHLQGQTMSIGSHTWYTSGVQETENHKVMAKKWQATGEPIGDPQFWLEGASLSLTTDAAIVYRGGNASMFGWSLSNPSEENGYICEVPVVESYRIIQDKRDFDYGLKSKDLNDLERGPHFIKQPHDIVVVGQAQTVELECVVIGRPVPIYSWWRGDHFEVEITPETDPRYTLSNGKLIIDNPKERADSGTYRCQAENKLGKVVSSDARLSFGSIGEFSNVPDAPVNAKSYEGAAIDCSRINYNPAVTYQWYKNDPSRFIRTQFQTYMFMSQNGKLYFSEVTRADEGDYHCIATLAGKGRSAIGSRQTPMRTSLPISLVVSDQTPLSDWGPRIQNEFIAVFPKPPLRGNDVRMECFAYGSSTSQFKYNWIREGRQQLPRNSQMLDHNRILVLRDASLDDQGVYTCTVRRGYSNTDERSVNLVLGARPYFLRPIGDQHLDVGAQFTWRCEVRANPAASYQWFKNGQPLTSDPDKFMLVRGNVLIFAELDAALHIGMYQCAATNEHGTTLSEGQLRVLAFAPTFFKNPLQPITQASLDGNITLQCKPESAPLASVTWSRDGGPISEWETKYLQKMNGDLVILGASDRDQGTFTCKAENTFGSAEDSTKLLVAEGTFITVPPKSTSAVVNSTAVLFCHASHAKNSDMVFSWFFNGFRIDPKIRPEFIVEQNIATSKTSLYIRSVQFHHRGHYECKATTPMTEDSQQAYLPVQGSPASPAGVFSEPMSITQNSVIIRWTVTNNHGRSIVGYMVEAESIYEMGQWEIVIENLHVAETVEEAEEKPMAHIKDLNPGCGYRFRVSAFNEFGYGPASKPTAFIHTLSAPPAVTPLHIGGGGGSVGDLTITWQPLTRTQEGGRGIGYIVEWRKNGGESYLDKKWSTAVLKSRTNKFVKLVGADNYFLEYQVKITAFNDNGNGPTSDVVIVMSAENLPGTAPSNIYADGFNGTAMEVFWDPIPDKREDAKGIILGYQVNYWHEEEEQIDFNRFIRYRGQRIDTGIVIGLMSDNFYYFTVQAYNSAGLGPVSDFYLQETLHAPPVHYPEEVRVSSAGGHRVHVWWRGIQIAQPEAAIQGFTVFYWPANENYRNAMMHDVPGHDSHTATIKVEDGVVYALRVSGYSAGGLGRKSLTTYFTFEGDNILVDQNLIDTVEAFESKAPTFVVCSMPMLVTLTASFFIIQVLAQL